MIKLFFRLGLLVALFPSFSVEASILDDRSIDYSSSVQINDFGWYTGQPFSLLKFNSALGELQSIEVEMCFSFFGDVYLSAPLAEESVDINQGDIFTYFRPELYADFGLIPGTMIRTIPVNGPLPPGYDQIVYENFSWDDQYNIDLLNVSNALDEYTGPGDAPLGIYTGFSSTIISTPVSIFMDGTLDVGCTITYNYTVPEPTSLLIFVAGGVAILRRKKGRPQMIE